MRNITAIFILLFTLQTHATEIDDTTSYYDVIPDSEAVLNAKVQRLIDKNLASYHRCDLNIFSKRAAHDLTGNLFYGAIESQANKASQVSKQSLRVGDSIYKNTPYETSVVGRLFGLGSTINVNGHHIGTDKLGHFFDMGYSLFILDKEEEDITVLVEKSTSEQQGLWGAWTTGVKSYGDIAANFDGFRFWKDFAGRAANPYFVCEGGSLKQVRAFLWSDYVSDAWTEAINCSKYNDVDYDFNVAKNVHELETKTGKRFQCPIEPTKCDELRGRYAQWLQPHQLAAVISPECRLKPSPEWF